jgi:hypothetical protein
MFTVMLNPEQLSLPDGNISAIQLQRSSLLAVGSDVKRLHADIIAAPSLQFTKRPPLLPDLNRPSILA